MKQLSNKLVTGAKILFGLAVLLSFCSCNKEQENEHVRRAKEDEQAIKTFLQENQIEAQKGQGGIFYFPIRQNPDGALPAAGNVVDFYYKITLLDGTVVASHTEENGAPVKAMHFKQAVFPGGIDVAFQYVRKGEVFGFLLPSATAFYDYSNSKLPQYANLYLELEVVDVLTSDNQKEREIAVIESYLESNSLEGFNKLFSGMFYKVVEEGTGSKPVAGQRASMKYKGYLMDGTVFDQSKDGETFKFIIGQDPVIKGWEQGVKLMQKGEKAIFIIPSQLAYEGSLAFIPKEFQNDLIKDGYVVGFIAELSKDIPPFSTLIFEVSLEEIN